MQKTRTIGIAVVIFIFFIFGMFIMNMMRYEIGKNLIKKSFPIGDFAYDNRTAEQVCDAALPEVQKDNFRKKCTIKEQTRIEDEKFFSKCVDGASIAGCFYCEFECS